MKKIIVLLALFVPFIVNSQEGIRWSHELNNWPEVIQKAQLENKFIFVDCYATWCQPCHEMDKEVFSDPTVAEAINDKFVSVKIQMDKTNYDSDRTKGWYNDAGWLSRYYSVTAFPTFLFFYPEGKPMHRSVGYRDPKEFIILSEEALDPQKQYYALLQNYRSGKYDTSELKGLARVLKQSEGNLATEIALEYLVKIPKSELPDEDNVSLMKEFGTSNEMKDFVAKYLSSIPDKNFLNPNIVALVSSFHDDTAISWKVLKYLEELPSKKIIDNLTLLTVYKTNERAKKVIAKYLNALTSEALFNKDNLTFIYNVTNSSKDKGFNIFYNNQEKIDKVIEAKGFALSKILNIIMKEEYDKLYANAMMKQTDNIPWNAIKNKVEKKYNKGLSDQSEIHVKASLYGALAKINDDYWPKYIDAYILEVEKYGTDTSGPSHKFIDVVRINNFVYDAIFLHSTNSDQIETGLKWMEGVIRRNPGDPNNIDTYANLLYKSGKICQAIHWQEKAVQTAVEENQEWCLPSLKDNLAKMKNGEPTWIEPEEKKDQ